MNPFYLTLVFPIISIAILLGVLVYYNRKLARIRRSFQELARKFNGTIFQKSMVMGDILKGQHGGIPFTCRYFMGSKNSPPYLTIQASIPCPVKLAIRREYWYDRFAKWIGLIAELQTGDPVFDQTYLLDTEQDDTVQSYLADEEKRREIDALFNLGFPVREIVFGKNDFRIVLSPFQGDAIASVPLEKYLDALLNLSSGLASVDSSGSFSCQRFSGSRRPPIHRVILVLLFILNGFLIPGGAFTLAYGMNQYEPLGNRLILNALFLSVPAAFIYLIGVFGWIRGRSSSHRLFLIILILSLIGFPLAITGGAVATNGLFDEGIETSHRVSVTDHYYRKNKNSKTYYVAFLSWQRPDQTDRISVPYNFFQTVHQGDDIVIRAKPGYWQEEWIAGINLAPEVLKKHDLLGSFPLKLQGIRFYESEMSNVPEKDRGFATEFAREKSRYIYCHLDMENDLWQVRNRSYTFVWKYINPDGSLLGELSLPFTICKEWRTAWVRHSWGWDKPGYWPPGNYRVVVLIDGRPFGEGTFTVR
jgi:hypothetical protein